MSSRTPPRSGGSQASAAHQDVPQSTSAVAGPAAAALATVPGPAALRVAAARRAVTVVIAGGAVVEPAPIMPSLDSVFMIFCGLSLAGTVSPAVARSIRTASAGDGFPRVSTSTPLVVGLTPTSTGPPE